MVVLRQWLELLDSSSLFSRQDFDAEIECLIDMASSSYFSRSLEEFLKVQYSSTVHTKYGIY